jgi:hypothetical protein
MDILTSVFEEYGPEVRAQRFSYRTGEKENEEISRIDSYSGSLGGGGIFRHGKR